MIKGIKMTLGDGVEYTIPPLSLGAIEDLEEQISAMQGAGVTDKATIKTTIDVAHAALLRNYPAMERETVRELLDLGNMVDVFECVMDVSGLKRQAIEAGEAAGASA